MRLVAIVLVSAFAFTHCGRAPNRTTGDNAESPEQALSWLAPEDRTAFEKWRDGLEKQCVASQVFSESAVSPTEVKSIGLRLNITSQ